MSETPRNDRETIVNDVLEFLAGFTGGDRNAHRNVDGRFLYEIILDDLADRVVSRFEDLERRIVALESEESDDD